MSPRAQSTLCPCVHASAHRVSEDMMQLSWGREGKKAGKLSATNPNQALRTRDGTSATAGWRTCCSMCRRQLGPSESPCHLRLCRTCPWPPLSQAALQKPVGMPGLGGYPLRQQKGSHKVDQAGLKPVTFLPQPPRVLELMGLCHHA